MSKYNDFVKQTAETIIELIKHNKAPWQKGWSSVANGMPCSASTGVAYSGINLLLLMIAASKNNYKDNRWITYNAARAAGGYIKKGQSGVKCVHVSYIDKVIGKDQDGNNLIERKVIPSVFVVFNIEQTENVDINKIKNVTPHKWDDVSIVDNILKNSKANIIHSGQRPHYNINTDTIVIPEKTSFFTSGEYYCTALHELAHWTGAKSRLNRIDKNNKFGDQGYAREELIAEICSMMVANDVNLKYNNDNSISYINSWIALLTDHPKEIFNACSAANKAKQYIINFAC